MINPLIVEGHIHGGLAQGLGPALLEHCAYDAGGQPVAGSFMDYAIARADDLPDVRDGVRREPAVHAQSARRQGLRRGRLDRHARGAGERRARRAGRARRHRPRNATDAGAGMAEDTGRRGKSNLRGSIPRQGNSGTRSNVLRNSERAPVVEAMAFLQNIAWLWSYVRKYKYLIVIAIFIPAHSVLTDVLASGNFTFGEQEGSGKSAAPGDRFPGKSEKKALGQRSVSSSVTARRASSRSNVSYALDIGTAAYLNRERAVADFLATVVGAAHEALESMTIAEARENREKIEAFIVGATKDAQKQTGRTIKRITILKIVAAR